MKKFQVLCISFILLACLILFSSWGSAAHKKINYHAPASFPYQMNFLKATWPGLLYDHASDADYRKDTDVNEAPKHFIDIDNYSEFILHGRIPQTFDSIVMGYGLEYVLGNGIIPWATKTTFDSLKACFQRDNFYKAMLFAADLGHYVGDGHQPLHITRYYNGMTPSQHNIHSRYETGMINDFNNLIIYPDDSAIYISDVQGYIFSYIYSTYPYVDSVLLADDYAQALAGNYYSDEYYNALWSRTGTFTVSLMKHASFSLASLIYTAWVDAGSPNSIWDQGLTTAVLLHNTPNPFISLTNIMFNVKKNNAFVSLKIYDASGTQVAVLLETKMDSGDHEVTWQPKNLPSGLYYCVLQSGGQSSTSKLILAH